MIVKRFLNILEKTHVHLATVSCFTDADFDSYWEDESKSKNRNRIHVGCQYQAIVPPLLKPGESDGRHLEDLETLKWKPNSDLTDQQLDQYFSVARFLLLSNQRKGSVGYRPQSALKNQARVQDKKAVSFFARAVDKCHSSDKESDKCIQTALIGLIQNVTSHHPCHHDTNCQISRSSSDPQPSSSNWTYDETQLFARALEACGKNFSAIKNDFLPWKPVKSIIEYYYQGKENRASTCCKTPISMFSQKESVDSEDPGELHTSAESSEEPDLSTQEEHIDESEESKQERENELQGDLPTISSALEVTPMKAKPVPATPDQETSPLGSLKFYFRGKLVLKLNAQQQSNAIGNQCQWVQSIDTPKVPFPRKLRRCKKNFVDKTATFVKHEDGRKSVSVDLEEVEGGFVKKAKLKNDFAVIWPEESFVLPVYSPLSPPSSDLRHLERTTPHEGTLSPLSGVCSDPNDSDVSPLQSPTDKYGTKKMFKSKELWPVKEELSIKPEPMSPSNHLDNDSRKQTSFFGSGCHQKPQGFGSLYEEKISHKYGVSVCKSLISVPVSYPSVLKTALEATDTSNRCSYKLNNIKKGGVPIDLSVKPSQSFVNKSQTTESVWQTDGKLNIGSEKPKNLSWPGEFVSYPCEFRGSQSSNQLKLSPSSQHCVSFLKSPASSPVSSVKNQPSLNTRWPSLTTKPPPFSTPVISSATSTFHLTSTSWTSCSNKPNLLSPTHMWESEKSLTSYQEQLADLTYLTMPINNITYPTDCVENMNGVSAASGVNCLSQEDSSMKLRNIEVTGNYSSSSQEKEEIPSWISSRSVDLASYLHLYPHLYSYYPYAYNLAQASWNRIAASAEISDDPLDLSSSLSNKKPCSPQLKETTVECGTVSRVPKVKTDNAEEKGMLYQLLKKRESIIPNESIYPQEV
ncbi:uncharacterized protein LOC106465775 isoform X2 [Limulus polyphemus]|uniref:Uncharacterized protein LOC106465775 isoform X2 n=1 Tax=Limulus polyphemus TaxID=6850 RepID=A0ABM1T0L2_LIMPO|nr:uncharacterized protein LOC106465775 isoform X2 [Limulus polyphemus]